MAVGFMQLDISSTNTYIQQRKKKKYNLDKLTTKPPSYKNQNILTDAHRKEKPFTIFRSKLLMLCID